MHIVYNDKDFQNKNSYLHLGVLEGLYLLTLFTKKTLQTLMLFWLTQEKRYGFQEKFLGKWYIFFPQSRNLFQKILCQSCHSTFTHMIWNPQMLMFRRARMCRCQAICGYFWTVSVTSDNFVHINIFQDFYFA